MIPKDADLRFRGGLDTGGDVWGDESGEDVFDLGACGGLEDGGLYFGACLRTTRVVMTFVGVDAWDGWPEKKPWSVVALVQNTDDMVEVGKLDGTGDVICHHSHTSFCHAFVYNTATFSLSLCSLYGHCTGSCPQPDCFLCLHPLLSSNLAGPRNFSID